jgi:uncharacterized membrane protein YgdD (TMEM256/DUF423 family)
MMKKYIAIGAVMGFVAVLLGAMAAHALKKMLSPEEITSFQTGVRYFMYHAIVLLVLGFFNTKELKMPAILLLTGSILFSFSIFFIYFFKILNISYQWLGPITPLGGLILLAGWGMLFFKSRKYFSEE